MSKRHPLANCEVCPRNTRQTSYAGAIGPENATIVFVGESPSYKEGKNGKPWQGLPGQLLGSMMHGLGMDAKQVRMTNVVACHAPYTPGKAPTAPSKEVIECCSPRLEAELQNRSTAVAFGSTAKQILLKSNAKISDARIGPPKVNEDGLVVIPTYNPGMIIRSSDYYPSLLADLKKLKSVMSGTANTNKWVPPDFVAYDTVDEALGVIAALQSMSPMPIALDIETDVDKDQYYTHPKGLLCIGLAYAPKKAVVLGQECLTDETVRKALGELIATNQMICHNGKYDQQVLMRMGIIDFPHLWFDTMLASYSIDERPGHHGLESLSMEILGTPSWKAEIKKYKKPGQSYAVIPKDVLYRYNAYDVSETYNLAFHFIPVLKVMEARELHDRLVKVSQQLTFVELDGVNVDQAYLDKLTISMRGELDDLENWLGRWVDNPRSTQQVKEVLSELKIPAPNTQAATLEEAAKTATAEQLEFLSLLLEHRKLQKLYGTYVNGTRAKQIDNKVYPTYMVHGTVFGRLSCNSPNLQNVPRGPVIKNLFVARPGNILIQADYSQAELRVIACLAKDQYLHEVFQDESRDIHGELAAILFGPDWTKEQRVRAKSYVFGSIYGMEPYTIAKAYDIPEARAKLEQDAFFGLIPQVMAWRRSVEHQVFKRHQVLQTPYGRKRRFYIVTDENKEAVRKAALAFYPQSIANDICLSALVKIRQQLNDKCHIRFTVHDSIVVECPEEMKEEVTAMLLATMVETGKEFSDFVPFKVDAEYGYSLGDLKEAEEDVLV